MNHAIRLEEISTSYGKRGEWPVTAPFSEALPPGTFACLLGDNGSGKSTLLRTIAGLRPPQSGKAFLLGNDASAMNRHSLALTVGVVLTDRQPFSSRLTAEEVVAMGRIPHTGFMGGMSESDSEAVERAMRHTGIWPLRNRRVAALSDGERQKTMIAKALAQDTPIIILDEPTAFLDFSSKAEVFRLLADIAHRGGRTVVAATHDVGTAMHMADKLWLMARGEKPVCGAPGELAAAGKLDRMFEKAGAELDRESLTYNIYKGRGK